MFKDKDKYINTLLILEQTKLYIYIYPMYMYFFYLATHLYCV